MNAAGIVSLMTVIASISIKLIGEPDQIRRNYKRRSTVGLSPLLYGLSVLSYSLWTVHGLQTGDMAIIVAQSAGILTSGIILFQMWRYRKSHASSIFFWRKRRPKKALSSRSCRPNAPFAQARAPIADEHRRRNARGAHAASAWRVAKRAAA
jgi:uncharacterized protein with PQ loop repeat